MRRHWSWDFEEERAADAAPLSAQAPSTEGTGPKPGGARFRRRRFGAALGLAILVAGVAVALSSSHAHGSRSTSSEPAARSRPRLLRARPPEDSAADERAAVAAVLAYTPFVKEAGGRGKDIALTFDDGPGPYTPGVLDVLERYHVQATFFAIGEMERYFSASTIREIRDGDAVGDHTETHLPLASLSAHDQHEELFEQIARIELLGGPRPTLFRPPYGSFNTTTIRELRALHLLMILWSVDTGDYLLPGVSVIVQRALAGAHPGAIILMHDGGGDRSQTIAALPTIIRELRARGFHLVTIPRLLLDDPPPRGQPLPPSLAGD
jgi:peptidoglycan/xylan/chitin deacetylase (PgdA/CDA1 family)